MKKIRMKVGVSGDDFSWRPGQELELSDAEAAKWADGERAEYVDGPPDRETTVQPPDVDGPPRPGGDTETTEQPPAPETTEPPAGNASRDEWAAYVVDVLKVDPEEIEGLGRDKLRDQYGPKDTEA